MRAAIVAILCLFTGMSAFSDEAAVRKYRNFTPQQIKALPESVLNANVPIMYTMAAGKGLSEGAELVFGMELNRLMYPGLGDYKQAVKAFQKDLGDPPNGVMTVGQIHELGRRAEMQQLAPISFPDRYKSFMSDDFASIEGTVVILDEKIAWPVNRVRIRCFKKKNYCEHDQLNLLFPDKTSWIQRFQLMELDTDYYEITQWGRDNIDATYINSEKACRTTSMNLNFKTKEFYFVTRNAGGDCEFLGQKIDKLPKPRISQVIDGEKLQQKEFEALQRKAFEVLSSDFRKSVEKLANASGKK